MFSPSGLAILSDLSPPDYSDLSLSMEQKEHVLNVLRGRRVRSASPLMERVQLARLEAEMEIARRGAPVFPCRAGALDAVVFEDGRVSVCENFRSFAWLRDYAMDFAAAWDSPYAHAARQAVHGCACTHPCNINTSMTCDHSILQRILCPNGAQ